jgi:WD40 repeat protein
VQIYSGKNISLSFAPDGNVLASQSAFDPLVKLWDVKSGRLLSTIDVEPSLGEVVSFSPDGTALILAARGAVREWDIATRRSKALVNGLSVPHPRVAVTPDTRTLAIAEGGLLTIRHRAPFP